MRIIHEEWDFTRIMNLANLYKVSELLFVSLEVDLFSRLKEPKDILQLSKELSMNRDFLEVILIPLTSINLLKENEGKYSVNKTALPFLNKDSKNSIKSLIELERITRNKNNLNQMIIDVLNGLETERIEYPEKNTYTNAMTSGTSLPALAISRFLLKHFHPNEYIDYLDLGCGPGDYAITFKKFFQNLKGTLVDREEIIRITRERLEKNNLLGDFKTINVDFMKEEIPGKYNLILLSNVCHFYSLEELDRLLHRIPLSEGNNSYIVIHDFFMNENLTEETFLSIFSSLDWLGNHSNKFNYTLNQIATWLEYSGWEVVEKRDLKGSPTSFILIKKNT